MSDYTNSVYYRALSPLLASDFLVNDDDVIEANEFIRAHLMSEAQVNEFIAWVDTLSPSRQDKWERVINYAVHARGRKHVADITKLIKQAKVERVKQCGTLTSKLSWTKADYPPSFACAGTLLS